MSRPNPAYRIPQAYLALLQRYEQASCLGCADRVMKRAAVWSDLLQQRQAGMDIPSLTRYTIIISRLLNKLLQIHGVHATPASCVQLEAMETDIQLLLDAYLIRTELSTQQQCRQLLMADILDALTFDYQWPAVFLPSAAARLDRSVYKRNIRQSPGVQFHKQLEHVREYQ